MKNPEEIVTELLERNRNSPPATGELELKRVVDMILTDRFELVRSIAATCGSPEVQTCKCGELFFFLPTKAGKFQPVVPDEGISHFITCREAAHYGGS